MQALRYVLLALVTVLLCGTAQAEEDPNTLFNKALDLARAGQTEQAIDLWLAVLDKVDGRYRPSVHRTLGLGFGKLGRYPEAAYHLHRYLETRLDSQSRKTREKLAAIEAKLTRTHTPVTIACDPEGAVVQFTEDGSGTGYGCPLKWWFEKGRHAVRVSKVGYRHSITHVTVQAGAEPRLHTVELASVQPDAADRHAAQDELLHRIQSAAKAGQASVLRKLALDQGAVFSGLDCEWGFNPATRSVNAEHCHAEVFELLAEAGARMCPDADALETALQLGCPRNVDVLLSTISDDDLVTAVHKASATYRGSATLSTDLDIIAAQELARTPVQELCRTGGKNSPACQAIAESDQELRNLYGHAIKALPSDELLKLLAVRPELTRKFSCHMAHELVSTMNQAQCDERTGRLALLELADGPTCDLRQALKRVVYLRCRRGFDSLLAVAATEDVALATRDFNEGDRLLARVVPTYEPVDSKEVLGFAKVLLEANQVRCRKEGPSSPACESARYVEEQMERIVAAEKSASDPNNILRELCLFQEELDRSLEDLARIKRVGELSGVPKKHELVAAAERIVGQEANVTALARKYKHAARKAYTPQLCK